LWSVVIIVASKESACGNEIPINILFVDTQQLTNHDFLWTDKKPMLLPSPSENAFFSFPPSLSISPIHDDFVFPQQHFHVIFYSRKEPCFCI